MSTEMRNSHVHIRTGDAEACGRWSHDRVRRQRRCGRSDLARPRRGVRRGIRPAGGQPGARGLAGNPVGGAGYTSGPAPTAHLTLADHAAHAAALLDHLGIQTAHIVGHSSGSAIVMQLGLDRPDLVTSLVLSEPPLIDPLADPADLEFLHTVVGPMIGSAVAAADGGDVAAAFDTFMSVICGPDYRSVLHDALGPEGLAQAEQESRFFFADEIPAIMQWRFDEHTATGLRAQVLLVQGGASARTGAPARRKRRRDAPARRDRHHRRRGPPPAAAQPHRTRTRDRRIQPTTPRHRHHPPSDQPPRPTNHGGQQWLPAPYLGRADDHPRIRWIGGMTLQIVLDSAASNGQLMIMRNHAGRGDATPVHVHHREDEVFHVLDGTITVWVGNHRREAGAGDACWLPPRDPTRVPRHLRHRHPPGHVHPRRPGAGFPGSRVDRACPTPGRGGRSAPRPSDTPWPSATARSSAHPEPPPTAPSSRHRQRGR